LPVIFVVDNNSLFRRLTVQYLTVADFDDILTFSDADDCLRYIDLHPDIVITELYYGENEIDGIELLTRIKSISPKTQVIFLSSSRNMDAAVQSVRLGAVDFIFKGKLALDKLIMRIKQLSSYNREIKKANSVNITITASLVILIVLFISLIFLYGH
jgi:two-component system OmpR family response regulator